MSELIGVIILNYNTSDDCRKCISYLKAQTGVELEIIVVDNCSQKADAEQLSAFCSANGVAFIQNSENRGYSAGNNVGLRYASQKGCKYAMIVNPDMEFPNCDYVSSLVKTIEQDPEIVVCGSDIVTLEGTHQNPKFRDEDNWKNSFNWIKEIFSRKSKEAIPSWVEDPHKSGPCRCLNGCCLLLRISFLQEIGFLDEHTFLYGEEPILGRQVELAGKCMYYSAETFAVHNHIKSKEGSSAFKLKHWRHSQLHFIRCYSSAPRVGKWLAMLSVRTYFLALRARHSLRNC